MCGVGQTTGHQRTSALASHIIAMPSAPSTPGRTREINFFVADERLRLVDLPGYGFAKVSRDVAKKFQNLGRSYLRGRPNLKRAYLLIDARQHRTQAQNRESARERLVELLQQASIRPKRRRKTKPTAGSKERRFET